jgi:hypothetical protein
MRGARNFKTVNPFLATFSILCRGSNIFRPDFNRLTDSQNPLAKA